MENKYRIILIIIALICIGIFIHQYTNNAGTLITLNETSVKDNTSFAGVLTDAYGWGVANQTITYNEPGNPNPVSIKTDDDGKFIINAEYAPNTDNKYKNFTFHGEGKYQASTYDGTVQVTL